MARKNPVPQREKEIGARLSLFRESVLGMTRATFAQRIGIDSKRLETYELGRVPLRARVFLAIHSKFFLNPVWLATGQEHPAYDAPMDFGRVAIAVEWKNWVFSDAYDRAFKFFCKNRTVLADALASRITDRIQQLVHFLREERDVRMTPEVAFLVRARLRDLDSALDVISHFKRQEKPLTALTPERNLAGVKSLLAQLRKRLQKATETTGKKGELARFLNVPPPRVSEWLSDDPKTRVDPSGETALRLLQWVERQESALENPPAVHEHSQG